MKFKYKHRFIPKFNLYPNIKINLKRERERERN